MRSLPRVLRRLASFSVATFLLVQTGRSADATTLQQQLDAQAKVIEELRAQVEKLTRDARQRDARIDELSGNPPAAPTRSSSQPTIIISGQGAAGLFSSGRDGQFSSSEFRVDEARLAVEARITDGAYAVFEVNLTERENTTAQVYLGEVYAELEDVGLLFGRARTGVGLRLGRFDVPFGEEYLARDAIDNPLISHSLADWWGVDEGVEIFGKAGGANWIFAVQNGGRPYHQDFNADKALTFRVGGDPAKWLHLGGSAFRTGRLNTTGDGVSEMWFANGVFVSIGNRPTTTHFAAEALQIDARGKWATGYLHVAAGRVWYDDDDTTRDNSRSVDLYSAEVVQRFGGGWYGAGRYSHLSADRGYPMVGLGGVGKYGFSGILTQRLNRLSLALGWQIAEPLVWKTEYSWETGRTTTGASRDNADTFASEIAVKF